MKQYFSHISTILIAVLQFSICTGGLFSASLTFAGTALAQSTADASIDSHLYLCATATENTIPMSTENTSDIQKDNGISCTQGKACFSSLQQSTKNVFLLTFEPVVLHMRTFDNFLDPKIASTYIVQYIERPPSVSLERNMVQRE